MEEWQRAVKVSDTVKHQLATLVRRDKGGDGEYRKDESKNSQSKEEMVKSTQSD